ncbi:MAG: hypothetical protein ABSB14_10095 [Candidatus Sulfotelmatobacter sp.]
MKNISRLLSAVLVMLSLAWSLPAVAQTIYVSTTGSDTSGTGSSGSPFASLAKAQSFIETSTCGTRSQSATVNIGQGTYYLLYSPTNPGTLAFTCKDSGTSTYGVTWQPNSSNTAPVVVSGAIRVGGTSGTSGLGLTWTLTSGYTNVYQVTLPSTYNNNNPTTHLTYNLQPFEYLYYLPSGGSTPTRRLRARIEQSTGVGYYISGTHCVSTQTGLNVSMSLCNLGTYLRVSSPVLYNSGTNTPNCPNDGVKCLDRFVFSSSGPDGIFNWTNLNGTYSGSTSGTGFSGPCNATSGSSYPEGDIGLTLIDAWTVDAMRIACIDNTNDIIYLTGATKANTGLTNFFGPNTSHRYYIENVRNAFIAAQAAGQTGLWYWDRSTSILYYIVNPGENLSTDTVLIPQLPYSSVVASGQQLSNQFPQTGSDPSDFVGGSLLWAKAPTGSASGLSYVNFDGITFQMDDFVPSFTGFNNDDNGDMPVPQAIDCESCQHVVFNGDTVAYTSGSGILIASPPGNTTTTAAATDDTVENSSFLDIGDSGIRLGHVVNTHDLSTYVVNNITVSQNLVDGYSRVFADGEGIAEANGQGNMIENNDVTDGYHAGISICQESCGPFSSGVGVSGSHITTQSNRLWNLMQGVTSDGGSLYYNVGGPAGSGTGNTIAGNLVHDTTDSSIIDGFMVIPGTGYGGNGIYLDSQTGGTAVEDNVVYHLSGFAISLTEGPSLNYASNPNTFENNIFSLPLAGVLFEQTPWPQGCPSSGTFTTVNVFWNIFNFDQTDSQKANSFFVNGGCQNSCGQNYYNFQNFEANIYYNTKSNFCTDTNAFHVLDVANQSTLNGSCPNFVKTNYDWLTFDNPPGGSATWQHGVTIHTPTINIDEDDAQNTTSYLGTCSWNPNFGTTGNPSDYIITSTNPPPAQFNYNATNSTINSAGRTGQPTPAVIPETLPTYSYTNTQF